MKTRLLPLLGVLGALCLLSLPFAVTASDDDVVDAKHADKSIYVCEDREDPCLADTAEGCSDCGEEVEKKAYTLHNHMEMVGMAAKVLRDEIKGKNLDNLGKRTAIITKVAGRVSEFDPPRNTSSLDKYNEFASQMETSAKDLTKAAEAKDMKALKSAYRDLNRTCNGCHQLYRE